MCILLLQCTVRYATIILLFKVSFSICKKYWKPWSCHTVSALCTTFASWYASNFYENFFFTFAKKVFILHCICKWYNHRRHYRNLVVFRGRLLSAVCVLASKLQDPFFILALDGVDEKAFNLKHDIMEGQKTKKPHNKPLLFCFFLCTRFLKVWHFSVYSILRLVIEEGRKGQYLAI